MKIRLEKCSQCGGKGIRDHGSHTLYGKGGGSYGHKEKCPACRGTGKVPKVEPKA